MKKLVLLASLLVAFAPSAKNPTELNKYQKSNSGLSERVIANPLPVQMESKYVTDRSLWGRLIFDRDKVSSSYQIIEDKPRKLRRRRLKRTKN